MFEDRLLVGMKISDIFVYIFSIYLISVMFDDIGDNRYIVDISILDRYIVETSGLWHMCALV